MKSDIKTREDVYNLVSSFYSKVRVNETLGPFFDRIEDWDEHLDRLTTFWESSLFLKTKYYGDPLKAHTKADKEHGNKISELHFGVWLNLWYQTIEEMFEGETAQNAKRRARKMGTFLFLKMFEITDDISSLNDADVYIIAVSDDAIGALSSQLQISNKLVVHTSGSVSLHALDKKHRRGVFYPLQTFSKEVDINFSEVPICIEIEDKDDLQQLKDLSEAIGSKYYKVNSDQRSALHLAAVFVNNFTNQLYRVGHEITESKSVDFNILKPLIKETASKIESLSPYLAQTGPAKRMDKKTIKKHLKALDKDIHKEIYELMTKSIKLTHGKKL